MVSSFGRREILYSFKKIRHSRCSFSKEIRSTLNSKTSKSFSASALRRRTPPISRLDGQIPPEFNMDKGRGKEKDNVASVRTCPIARMDVNILNVQPAMIRDTCDSQMAVRSRKQASCQGVGSPTPIEQLLSQRHAVARPSRCSSLTTELF